MSVRIRSEKKLYHVIVVYPNSVTKTIKVMASNREVAEQRALKRAPGAVSIQRS